MARAQKAADRGTGQCGTKQHRVSPPRQQPGNGPQAIRYRDVTLGAAILGGQVGFRMAAGPWWAGFLLAVLGLVAVGVRTVFPQDSRDKVAWWRELWRTSPHHGAGGKHRKRDVGRITGRRRMFCTLDSPGISPW